MAKVYTLVLPKNLNKMKKLIYTLLFLFAFKLQAQPPAKFFNKYGGNGIDIGYSIKEIYKRHYIVAGTTSSFGYGALDAYLLLIDSMGQKVWEKSYGGALTDVAKSVVFNPVDSGFIFTGHSNSIGNGGYDVLVVRTNKTGDLIWQKSFGGFDWDFGNDIVFAPDGNIIICGYSYSSKYGKTDGYILKLNSVSGALIWQRYYGGSEDDDFRAIKTTLDGNLMLTGKTNSYKDLKGDIYFFKLDLNGDSILTKTYGYKNKVDYGNDIIEESGSGYFIGGGSESYSSGLKDAFIFKLTTTGDSVWVNFDGKPTVDEECTHVSLTKHSYGRYVFTYNVMEVSGYKRDPKNMILTLNSFYLTATTFGGTEDDELYCLDNTKDRGFIGVGYTKSYGSINEDVYVIKYDSLLFSGGQLIGLKEINTKQELAKLFPSIITDDYPILTLQKSSDAKLEFTIFNIEGKEVQLTNMIYSPVPNKDFFNLAGLNSGIYILRIESKGAYQYFKFIKE